jgi:hypothetical protein
MILIFFIVVLLTYTGSNIRNIDSDIKITGRLKHKMQTFSKNDYDFDARQPKLLKRRANISAVFGCESNPHSQFFFNYMSTF